MFNKSTFSGHISSFANNLFLRTSCSSSLSSDAILSFSSAITANSCCFCMKLSGIGSKIWIGLLFSVLFIIISFKNWTDNSGGSSIKNCIRSITWIWFSPVHRFSTSWISFIFLLILNSWFIWLLIFISFSSLTSLISIWFFFPFSSKSVVCIGNSLYDVVIFWLRDEYTYFLFWLFSFWLIWFWLSSLFWLISSWFWTSLLLSPSPAWSCSSSTRFPSWGTCSSSSTRSPSSPICSSSSISFSFISFWLNWFWLSWSCSFCSISFSPIWFWSICSWFICSCSIWFWSYCACSIWFWLNLFIEFWFILYVSVWTEFILLWFSLHVQTFLFTLASIFIFPLSSSVKFSGKHWQNSEFGLLNICLSLCSLSSHVQYSILSWI